MEINRIVCCIILPSCTIVVVKFIGDLRNLKVVKMSNRRSKTIEWINFIVGSPILVA